MGERKVRSDRKRDIKPTVSIELRECIYRLAYITDTPVKDVVEDVCINGIRQKQVISYLSRNFRRTVRIDNTLFLGDMERVSVKKRSVRGQNERISTRVDSDTYEVINTLAYALDCSVSRACSLLLDASIRDVEFLNEFVQNYLSIHVDDKRMKELKKVFRYINQNNPYSKEITWPSFLSYLIDEVKVSAEKVKDTVSGFVINKWSE